ncbi:MAG: hypothetical protein V5788_06485 [Shewanella sp.]
METIIQTKTLKTSFSVYTLPAFIDKSPVDHTYVEFDGHGPFPCHGHSKGGHVLEGASGEENYALAKKFNAKMKLPFKKHIPIIGNITLFHIPTGDTGIIYAINGVCHMMADRILVPSEKTVYNARGFVISSGLYGVYGVYIPISMELLIKKLMDTVFDGLPKKIRKILKKMLESMSSNPIVSFARLVEAAAQSEWRARLKKNDIPIDNHMRITADSTLGDKINSIYNEDNLIESTNLPAQEHEVVLKHILGEDIDNETINKLKDCMEEFRSSTASDSATKDVNGEKSTEDIMSELNDRANNYLSEANKILGAEKFEKLFKVKPGERIQLFDHKQFDATLQNITDSLKEQFKGM